jgi:hypothetical protein
VTGALSGEALIIGIGAAVGGLLIMLSVAFIRSRFAAPFRLDEERKSDLRAEQAAKRDAISEASRGYARELATLKDTQRAASAEIDERHARDNNSLKTECAVLSARYAALERQYDELKESRPRLTAGPAHRTNDALLLPITNDGAPARIWGKVSVRGKMLNARSNAYAAWNGLIADKITLGFEEHHDIVVARVKSSARGNVLAAHLWIPFIENGQSDEMQSVDAFPLLFKAGPEEDVRIDVAIEVFSDPPSTGGPISVSLTVAGSDWYDELPAIDSAETQGT